LEKTEIIFSANLFEIGVRPNTSQAASSLSNLWYYLHNGPKSLTEEGRDALT